MARLKILYLLLQTYKTKKMNLLQNTTLFWDTNIETIDPEKNARSIIERVLMHGTVDDWREIKQFYGLKRIKNEVVEIRYLDKLTISFLCNYFNLQKEQFKCFPTEQSTQQLWNY